MTSHASIRLGLAAVVIMVLVGCDTAEHLAPDEGPLFYLHESCPDPEWIGPCEFMDEGLVQQIIDAVNNHFIGGSQRCIDARHDVVSWLQSRTTWLFHSHNRDEWNKLVGGSVAIHNVTGETIRLGFRAGIRYYPSSTQAYLALHEGMHMIGYTDEANEASELAQMCFSNSGPV